MEQLVWYLVFLGFFEFSNVTFFLGHTIEVKLHFCFILVEYGVQLRMMRDYRNLKSVPL